MAFVNASAKVHNDEYEIYSFCVPDVCIIADFAFGNILRLDVGCKRMDSQDIPSLPRV